jgi:hypothetical protein
MSPVASLLQAGHSRLAIAGLLSFDKSRMKTPTFDGEGVDKLTFAPFTLIDARESKWKDVRLSFHDWDWFKATYGSDTVHEYYFNGYGVEGLVKAARLHAGLDPDAEGIDYDSEGDACFVHFSDLDEAVKTAEISAEMMRDRNKLVQMIALARQNGFDDA